MRGEFVDVGGCRLYYYAAGSRGSGDPILLIHGLATSSHLWSNLIGRLPAGHRVVVLDLLGAGRSDLGSSFDLSPSGHATRTLRLMDALGIDAATLVGHGMGGLVGMALSHTAPQRVSRLMVAATGVSRTSAVAQFVTRALITASTLIPPRWLLPTLKRRLARGYVDREVARHSLEQYLRPFTTFPGLRSLGDQWIALSLWSHHAHSVPARIPGAIVFGEDDPFVPRDAGTTLHACFPSATVEYIPGGRHFLPEEQPEPLSRIVAALLGR